MAGNYLLIDVSNSFTKIARATRRRISKPVRIATEKLTPTLLGRLLRSHPFELIAVASVVPKKNAVIRATAKGGRILWLTPEVKLGVGIEYPKPKQIGDDRL